MKNLLFALLFFSTSVFCQTNSGNFSPTLLEDKPENVGMSSERLKRIDVFLQKSIDQKEIPGAVALVCRNGKIVYQKAFGSSDNVSNKALKTDDIFRIASMSKAITSTAVMMLWEEGLFKLDDPISKYIPEFKNPTVLDSLTMSDTLNTVLKNVKPNESVTTELITPPVIKLVGDNQSEVLELAPENLWFLSSADNYVNIVFEQKNSLQSVLFRSTLKKMETALTGFQTTVRCYKGFIVNLYKIENVEASAQGLKLKLVQCTETVSVDKTFTEIIKRKVQKS